MWYNYSGASIYTFQFSDLTISSKSIAKICIMQNHFWGNFAQLRVMFLCCYPRADVRCLSRVTDVILWNIRKTRNSSVFQNVEEGLHLKLYFILSFELSGPIWLPLNAMLQHTEMLFYFIHHLYLLQQFYKANTHSSKPKKQYPDFATLLVAGNSVQA